MNHLSLFWREREALLSTSSPHYRRPLPQIPVGKKEFESPQDLDLDILYSTYYSPSHILQQHSLPHLSLLPLPLPLRPNTNPIIVLPKKPPNPLTRLFHTETSLSRKRVELPPSFARDTNSVTIIPILCILSERRVYSRCEDSCNDYDLFPAISNQRKRTKIKNHIPESG